MKRMMSIAAIALMMAGSTALACDSCGCKAKKAEAKKECTACKDGKACKACEGKKAEAKKGEAKKAECSSCSKDKKSK